ncbi:cytochrome c1, partial [Halomonas marinisediminis]
MGTFDRGALQRGFQVYKQVCSVCHGVSQLAFRNLKALGFNDEEIKALAAEYKVKDGPNDEGEMYERSALPSDDFVGPYANDQQARNANNG